MYEIKNKTKEAKKATPIIEVTLSGPKKSSFSINKNTTSATSKRG
jgi:hypothetical protein